MRIPRLGLALALLVPFALATSGAAPESDDVVLQAMADELERTMGRLRLEELDAPYFVQYRVDDLAQQEFTASFGALVSRNASRQRQMTVEVRVGDYSFDNSRFVDRGNFGGFRPVSGLTVVEEDYDALRQDLWLLTDGAYKTALEQMARKRAYVQGQRKEPEGDDFSQEEPVVFLQPAARLQPGPRDWAAEVRALSALCTAEAAIEGCTVAVRFSARTQYLANNEGARLRQGRTLAVFQASAEALTADGYRVNSFVSFYARTPAELPPPEELRQRVEEMLAEVNSLREAGELEHYVGPVLVEADAAAPLLMALLGSELDGGRAPLGVPEMMLRRELAGRFQTRILPAFFRLVDDPTREQFEGTPLLGHYEVDDEGVRARRVLLIEEGKLQDWLMSRRPGKDAFHSNGHGRSGLLGHAGARPGNLFLVSTEAVPRPDLEEQFLELCREEGREFCLVVRRLNSPSLRPRDFNSLRAIAQTMMRGGGGRGLPALEIYKVYPEDGRRERVRGALLADLRLRSLRDIVAAGNDYTVHNFVQLGGGGLGAFDSFLSLLGMGGSSSPLGLPTSLVAPSLLFEELDVRPLGEEPEKVRLVPRPELEPTSPR